MATSARQKTRVLKQISLVLALTRLGMVSERILRCFWPVWSVLFLVLAGLMLGLQDRLSVEAIWLIGVLAVVAALWFFASGFSKFRLPDRDDALARLDATLPGRPVQSLLDQPAAASEDQATQAIWDAHQARMAEQLVDVRPAVPDFRVARLDPFGFRFVAVLALAVGLIFGSTERLTSLARLAPQVASNVAKASWEGWIEPPIYTGLPTLYLNDQSEGSLQVPINSRLVLRFYGEIGALTLQETVSARMGELPSAADASQEFLLRQEGVLEIMGDGGRRWEIALISDRVPSVRILGAPSASARGEMTLPFSVEDDYDIQGGTALIALDLENIDRRFGLAIAPEPRPSIELQLPLPISGDRADFEEALIEDLSENVWAHLPVTIDVQVEDAAGQLSAPEQIAVALSARRFFDPLAKALMELRRDLLWSRENARRTAQLLRAISHRPEDKLFRKETDYLRLRTILRRLERFTSAGLSPLHRDEIAQELLLLALALEEGDIEDALTRMQEAQERLEEAMRNGASDEEIARLMQELRQATQDYMRQLAQQNRQNGDPDQPQPPAGQDMMQLSQNDLQRMMDRIQELMEQGRMAEAQQALREFQEMMENMQVAQGGSGQQSPGQQALNELGETLRNQQGLSDEAFRELQEQFNPNSQSGQSAQNEGFSGGQGRGQSHDGTGEGQSGTGGEEGEQGLAENLSDRQRALRQELGRQQQNLPGAGSPEGKAAREALGRAGDAMEGAEHALRENRLADAIDQQSEAMDALRDGMRNLGEAMAQQQQNGGNQNAAQPGAPGNRDPLGREEGSGGLAGNEDPLLQGEDVYRRARDLLDEIRRRSGDTERSEQERGYLRRLLDRF